MEFNFIVGRRSLTNGTEKPIAGFLNIGMAKDYADVKELDYLSNGYMYVDAPEGRHILGDNPRDERNKWYAPGEHAYVFDSSRDRAISIEDCKILFPEQKENNIENKVNNHPLGRQNGFEYCPDMEEELER